jgi:hypothetical protein
LTNFEGFPKIARLSRDCVITEKIDGTNAQILITELEGYPVDDCLYQKDGLALWAGSRSKWLTKEQDNFGFARWAFGHAEELLLLGPGRHFGEWWGNGIQRGYGLQKGEKRFSLFNTSRWSDDTVRPVCCHVVPVLYSGMFYTDIIQFCLDRLKIHGSSAAPGFMNPEGIVIFHTAGNMMFKKTIKDDEKPKGQVIT